MAAFLASGCSGGVSVAPGNPTISGDDAAIAECTVLPCLSDEAWDPVSCSCQVIDQLPDAAPSCRALRCAGNDVIEVLNGECVCVAIGTPTPPIDATAPIGVLDAASDSTTSDAPSITYFDAPYPIDVGPPDTGYCPFYPNNYCGNGYTLSNTPSCQCVPCAATCPAGQSPGPNCNGCVACNYNCPAGLVAGDNCSCVPPGTASTPPKDPGGPSCMLEGTYTCAAGSWCPLGTCPDGKTEYGCYCDATGKSTCALECPTPPPCQIPGQGTCPYGSQCVYGSCSSASDTELACSCYQNGQAYCSTVSCDAGISGPDAGSSDGGVTCLLEGYTTCNAGSFCAVSTCPDGTQVGCTCNADGTATCDLTCPTPKPCTIPGEGTCPYGSQCTFGTCNGNSGSLLSCYCNGTSVSCYTMSCSQVAFDGGASDN
jgi:hypothetical protein